MSVLEDVLKRGLKVIFCGTAAGKKSADKSQYYADPRNKFWRELNRIGLTPHQFDPSEYRKLLKYGIGLTDLAKNTFGNDDELSKDDFDIPSFVEKVKQFRPRIVAFTSKEAGRVFLGRKRTRDIQYGFQEETISKTRLFVLTSTSGGTGRHWSPEPWDRLATVIKGLEKQ